METHNRQTKRKTKGKMEVINDLRTVVIMYGKADMKGRKTPNKIEIKQKHKGNFKRRYRKMWINKLQIPFH